MSRNSPARSFYYGNNCIFANYRLSLQRVFHSIRFKVNKVFWGAAAPRFCLKYFFHYKY